MDSHWTCAQVEAMWKRLCERKKREADQVRAMKESNNGKGRHTGR